MSSELKFTITFHTPFLAATGFAIDGYDAAFDPRRPVSESALKGLMRHHAGYVLGVKPEVVRQIFGDPAQPSAWAWEVLSLADRAHPIDRHRVQINSETHTATDDMLLVARAAALRSSIDFTVSRATAEGEPEAIVAEEIVLTMSALAINYLGMQRRRGLGWVSVSGGYAIDQSSMTQIESLREELAHA